ncbi:CAP-Gly domain-containing linker protein 4 [Echinococcus granulosus]|uniref:Cytoskeleton associated protein CAP Gly containing ankyrin repeats n=1 Tax=Echinococcus granulosus TaxID=6210 RepID=A0A068WWX1_ECHGR|nr:CAP-Gly domain-containing linker protein 4 [Echinococcus granulosus]CDS24659.1 Cytoskeleton associated protein CAP Gly containing ankyrin repeats [Echinococcus granulosus]
MSDSQFATLGGAMPPKCLPSPRTVARVASNNHRSGGVGSTPFSIRRRFQRFDPVSDYSEANNTKSSSPSSRSSSRNYPITHPACDPPLCSDCRQFDARFSHYSEDANATGETGNEEPDFRLLLDPDRPLTPDYSEEDIVRMMLTATAANSGSGGGRLRGAWWCDKCIALLSAPDVGIGNLFALLRQWTPSTQLQLDTIVMEILKRGAHVDDRDGTTDMTLLHYTAKSGALGNEDLACKIADFLLDQGACLEARSGWGDMTPLHLAAYFDCPRVAQLLLARGADPLVRSAALEGATPLHLAAAQLSLGSARLLARLPLALAPRNNGLDSDAAAAADFAPLDSPLMCKDALDAALRTPYDCLPPAGELPEPLSSMRDRLAELLGPAVDRKTKLKLDFLGAGCTASSGYRVLPTATQHLLQGYLGSEIHSPTPQRSRSTVSPITGDLLAPNRSRSPGGSLLLGLLAPACSATEVAAPMPAETGVLSPRRPRRATVASTEPNTPFASPARTRGLNISPPPPPPPLSLTVSSATVTPVNHSLPSTSTVSAKVTLRAMGLALGDRVCVGPGGGSSEASAKFSATAAATSGRMGRLRYCGPVEFASGVWVGIELDEAYGKDNGSVNGVSYFECAPNHGIFAPIGRVYKVSRTNGQIRPCFVEANGRRSTPTPLQNIPVDVSHVSAKVDTGLHKPSATEDFKIGDRVLVAGLRRGTIRYVGETQFAPGIWYGVELSKAVGKNDGSVEGVRYFTCESKHGVFAPALRLQRLPPRNRSSDLASNNDMSQSVHADFLPDCQRRHPVTPECTRRSDLVFGDNYASLGRPRPSTASVRALTATKGGRGWTSSAAEEFYLQVGMQVLCTGELGTLRYIGPVDFTDGLWLGVELRGPHGRHDGAVAGRRYFNCAPNHGVLVRPSRVTFRGINAAKLLPPGMVTTFEKPHNKAMDTRSIQSHP